jgi:hypothetical protein
MQLRAAESGVRLVGVSSNDVLRWNATTQEWDVGQLPPTIWFGLFTAPGLSALRILALASMTIVGTVEITSTWPVLFPFTVRNIVYTASQAMVTDSLTFNLRKNLAPTSLSLVVAPGTGAGTVLSSAASPVSFVAGDLLSMSVQQSASEALPNMNGRLVLQ